LLSFSLFFIYDLSLWSWSGLYAYWLADRDSVYPGKGDPPSSSASAKDIQREKDLDAAFGDPPPLPVHLSRHDRRTSRVDVDVRFSPSLSLHFYQ